MEKRTVSAAIHAQELFYQVTVGLIASVWLINGLFCKVFLMVPRHQLIVASVLGSEHATLLTRIIGISETLVAFWIVSGYRPRTIAIIQVVVILAMNLLEFFLVPDLLLWGRVNLVFALLLVLTILYTEFKLRSSGTNAQR